MRKLGVTPALNCTHWESLEKFEACSVNETVFINYSME